MAVNLSERDRNELLHLTDGRIRFDEPMARHTTFRVGGPAAVFVTPRSLPELTTLLSWIGDRGLPFRVIGGGSNLLVPDKGIDRVVIRLAAGVSRLDARVVDDGRIRVSAGAGMSLPALCRYAIRNGYSGLNRLIGIPGTVGGALAGNAGGANGWISDGVESIAVALADGSIVRQRADAFSWAYRSMGWPRALAAGQHKPAAIVSATFLLEPSDPKRLEEEAREWMALRKKSQPIGQASAGCVFKNPASAPAAGYLIEHAGLKGVAVGGAMVSEVHANFIVNTGNATAADILNLIEVIRNRVKERWGIVLENELVVLQD